MAFIEGTDNNDNLIGTPDVGRWKSVQETRIVYTVFMSLFAAAKIVLRLENIDGPKTSLTH